MTLTATIETLDLTGYIDVGISFCIDNALLIENYKGMFLQKHDRVTFLI